MQQDYKWVIDRIINKYEGNYSNDPGDPGGPTRYGITYIDAAEKLHVSKSQAYGMMKTFPLATAEDIYRDKYAVSCKFDALNPGIDMLVLDYNINSGVARGPRVLQAILGLPQTGRMDNTTVIKANAYDPDKLIDKVCDERLHFMHQIKGGASWQRFGKGWGARVQDLRVTTKKLAHGLIHEVPAIPDQTKPEDMGKATHINPEARKTVVKTTGGAATGGGFGSHLLHPNPWLTSAVIVGIVVIGGVAYYMLVRSQKKAQELVYIPVS